MKSSQYYLQKIKNHKPLTKKEAKFSISLRWLVTFLFGLGFPLGIWLRLTNDSLSLLPSLATWTLLVISSGGALVLMSAWLARHRHGLDGQWGYAVLNKKEIQEICGLSDSHPLIGEAIGDLAVRCAEKDCPLRGRDLLMIRRYNKGFNRALLSENKMTH